MSRRRFFVPPENIRQGAARLPPDQAHHLRDVLRLRAGDQVEIFDGRGNGYLGKIEKHSSGIAVVGLRKLAASPEAGVQLVLALALTKTDSFEWVLEKAVELGVSEIIPVKTRNCDVRIPEGKLGTRAERWERIIRETCKQCRRFSVPQIRLPVEFEEFLGKDLSGDVCGFLFDERAPARWSGEPVPASKLLLCVGPEGGWDPREVEAAVDAGLQTFSLGPRILRSETAAIAALSIFQYRLGDLGPFRVTNDE